MKNLFNLCGGAILAAALATPAAAQTAGTYNGTQANGQGYALTLSTDPNNGMLAITAGSVGVDTTLCKPAGEGNVGWGTMAGHSQFKNIMHRKGAQDARRGRLFARLIREITVAARRACPTRRRIPRLRAAVVAARQGQHAEGHGGARDQEGRRRRRRAMTTPRCATRATARPASR
jgi:hypothetical protein